MEATLELGTFEPTVNFITISRGQGSWPGPHGHSGLRHSLLWVLPCVSSEVTTRDVSGHAQMCPGVQNLPWVTLNNRFKK